MSLPIWLEPHVAQDSVFRARSRHPLFSLVILIHEIGQMHIGKNFLLLEPPRSAVWHDEEGMYLFYAGSHREVVSFGMTSDDKIRSVGTRYRDPLNVKSGVSHTMWSGWMGAATLLESAVRRSPYFGRLQTIETSVEAVSRYEIGFSDADQSWRSHYDVWVTPRQTWSISCELINRKTSGQVTFQRGVPIRLARVTVERPVSFDHPEIVTEVVTNIELYPDIVSAMNEERPFPDAPWSYDEPVWDLSAWNEDEDDGWIEIFDTAGEFVGMFPPEYPEPPARKPKVKPDTNPDRPFMFMSASDQRVLNLAPHSEFRLNWKK